MERLEAYNIAKECVKLLKERFNVDKVYIFGSVIGDGAWHRHSDIDIAVEGLSSEDYLRAFFDIYDLLPSGLELDLVSLENAPAKLSNRIKKINDQNGVDKMVEDNIDRLKSLIELEFESLDKVSNQVDEFLKYASERGPDVMALRSTGSCIHDFYNGVERIFERIAVTLNGDTPAGENWHILLLKQMEADSPSRPAVINHELASRLLEYLKFRHLFRHIYGGDLNWEKLYPIAIRVPETLNILHEQVNHFLNQIQE